MNSFNACNFSWWDVLGPTSRTKDNHLFSFGEVDTQPVGRWPILSVSKFTSSKVRDSSRNNCGEVVCVLWIIYVWVTDMIAKNAYGPMPEPCLMEQIIWIDVEWPTDWVRSVRNCASQVITYCGQLKLTSFWSKISWQTVSKALLKSTKMHLTNELDSRSIVTLPKKWIRALVVLPVGRKANWSFMSEVGTAGKQWCLTKSL